MTASIPPDVEAMVSQQLASGRYESADDVLRSALRALVEQDDLAAIHESIIQWKAGDQGISLDDALQKIRAGHSD